MNTTAVQLSARPVSRFRQQERSAFASIPGMAELTKVRSEKERNQLCEQHPDAAFAQMILSNLFCHNRELNAIYLRAYQAILNGESVAGVRFRFDRELNAHWENHMWDD